MSKKGIRPDYMDKFDDFGNTIVEWIGKNAGWVVGVAFVAIIGFGISAFWQHSQNEKESQAQSRYFDLEKHYLEIKRGFDEAAQQSKVPKKAADTKPAPAAATGDIAKDFGSLPSDFEALVASSPNSIAAEMAAMNASELYMRYGMKDKALAILKKVNPSDNTGDLASALTLETRASVMADTGDCKDALTLWEKITQDPHAPYLRDESKLRMGLCYESQKDFSKAEQIYKEIATKEAKQGEREASRDAERYLHLLKMKQGTSGG